MERNIDVFNRNIFGSIVSETSYKNDYVVDVISWLTDLKESVPKEYQHTVKIEFDARNDYDSSVANLRVYYSRPETEEEVVAREIEERQRALNDKAWAERRLAEAQANLARMK